MNKKLVIECIKTQMQFVDEMTRDAFEMAIKALEDNCSEIPNNWIPCTPDTMPERGIDVLTYVSINDLIRVQTLDLYDDVLMWEEQSGYLQSFDTVAAWMPLPAPYHPKEDE